MLCVNAPRKTMAKIHMLVSFVLVIICTVLAFTPLLEIRLTDDTKDSIQTTFDFIESNIKEAPEEVQSAIHNAFKSFDLENASVKLSVIELANKSDALTEFTNVFTQLLEATDGEDTDLMEEKALELKDCIVDAEGNIRPEIRDVIIVVAAVIGPMLPEDYTDIDADYFENHLSEMIAAALPVIIGFIFAIILIIIMPIIYLVLAIVSLITTLSKLKDPVVGAAKMAKRMPKSIMHPMTLMLVPCLTDSIVCTGSTIGLLILAILGSVANVVFTRMHSWERRDITYANVVQGATVLSIIGFVIFYTSLLKMGILSNFLSNGFIEYLVDWTASGAKEIDSAVSSDFSRVLVAAFFALVASKYMAKSLRRISLASTPKRKGGARVTHIVCAAFILLVPILSMSVANSTANGGVSFLKLSSEQESAMTLSLVAVIIMLISEVGVLVLRKMFGKDIDREIEGEILSGVSVGPDKNATVPEVASAEATESDASSDDVFSDVAPADAEETPADDEEK